MSIPATAGPAGRVWTRPEGWILLGVMLAGLGFAAYTGHAWEDYWITFRASRNLATGQGLVFTPGERLHTFTSPLGVLIPAALSRLTGNSSDLLALWLFRVLSVAALGAAAALLYRVLVFLQVRPFARWTAVALVALDAKSVDFSINGMETGFLLFFLALTLHGWLVDGPSRAWRLGCGWGGLMWTRPDGCIYIGILAMAALLFPASKGKSARLKKWGRPVVIAGLICTALYLPWFLWAWNYYGSPVPHTIVAKGVTTPPQHPADLLIGMLWFPVNLLGSAGTSLQYVFLPAYAVHGGWAAPVLWITRALGLPAAFAWLVPRLRPQTRMISFAFLLGNAYLTVLLKSYYPWYLPPVAMLGCLTIGLILDELAAVGPALRYVRIAAAALVAGQAVLTLCVARQMQLQQALIEDGLRRPIGLWLREHARTPADTVMLEPLGYIGYYSGLRTLDYPGLSSRVMVETLKRLGPARQSEVALELKPDWLVLRPAEIRSRKFIDPASLQRDYELVETFDASERIRSIRWLPGRPYLEYDQTFLIYRRKRAPVAFRRSRPADFKAHEPPDGGGDRSPVARHDGFGASLFGNTPGLVHVRRS